MEIVKDKVAMLSNYEVLALLKDIATSEKSQKNYGNKQSLATVTYETTKYLENQPCGNQSEEAIKKLMELLTPFNLTKAEKLQILNHCPITPVEIHLIVEESEERLSEDDVQSLLAIVAQVLPVDDEECKANDSTEQS